MRRFAFASLAALAFSPGLAACSNAAGGEASSPPSSNEPVAPTRYVDPQGHAHVMSPVDPATLPRPSAPVLLDPLPPPSRVMLDERGWITTPKNQGGRGSCQTFATIGAIESEYLRQYGLNLDLSEEYLINMFNESGSPNWTGGGVSDKLVWSSYYAVPPETAWKYIDDEMNVVNAVMTAFGTSYDTAAGKAIWGTLNKGAPTFNPLNTDIGNYNSYVYPPAAAHQQAVYGPLVGGTRSIPTDSATLESILASGHPITFITGTNLWKRASQGNYVRNTTAGSAQFDHALLLVGYDRTNQVFRVKNSWDTTWENGGFANFSYDLLLNDIADAAYITYIRDPHQTATAGAGGVRGFFAATLNGVKGVVVIHHGFQDTGAVTTLTSDAGYFYGNDGSQLALEWVTGNATSATLTVNNGSSRAQTIYLKQSQNGWSYAAIGATGDTVEEGTWCRSVPTAGSKLQPSSYTDAINDPSVFATGACVASSAPARQPAIFVRSSGEADVVLRGPDDSLIYKWAMPGGAWSTATIAGPGTTFSDPAIFVRSSTGEADIVAQGPNNSLMYYWAFPGTAWRSAMIDGAGSTYSAPGIFVRSSGEADIVVQGPTFSMTYYHAMPGQPWWTAKLPAWTTFSAPSIFVRDSGEADVVAQGPNNSLMYYWAMPGANWSSAAIAGNGSTFSRPSIYVRSSGEADVVAEGPSHALAYHWAWPGSSWSHASIGSAYAAPSIFVRSTGEADVVAQGANGSLAYYHATPGSPWYLSTVLGAGSIVSAPSIVVRGTGEADVVAEGLNGAPVYMHAMPSEGWYVDSL